MHKIRYDEEVQKEVAQIFSVHGGIPVSDPPNSGIPADKFFTVLRTAKMVSREEKYKVPANLVAGCFGHVRQE